MRTDTKLLLLAATVAIYACTKPPEPPKGEPQGRAETQGIRNAEVIGVGGAAVANKIDGALNESDQRKEKLDAAIDAQDAPN